MKREIVDLMHYNTTIHDGNKYYDYTPIYITEAEGSSTIQPRMAVICPTNTIKHIFEITRSGVRVSSGEYDFVVFGTISIIRFWTEQKSENGKYYHMQALVEWEDAK